MFISLIGVLCVVYSIQLSVCSPTNMGYNFIDYVPLRGLKGD